MTNEITTTGVNILKALDKTMHKVEKQYKGEMVMVPSPNMRLNRNTPADVFQQLALMIQDLKNRKDFFVALIILGLALAFNLGVAFLAGIVLAYILKSGKVHI